MTEQTKEATFQEKLAEAIAADEKGATQTDEGGNNDGGEENTEVPNANEEGEGKEEVLDGDEGAAKDAASSDEDEEVDATPRVSLKKHQKTEERARKAEREAFEATARLNAFIEAQKLAAPITERKVEIAQNPYDKDMEPERFELWETKQETLRLKSDMEAMKNGQKEAAEKQKYIESVGYVSNTAGSAIKAAQNSGKMPDAVDAYNFLAEKVAGMGINVDHYMMAQVITPISEGRADDIPGIYRNLAVSLGYKPAKKAPNGDAIERNRAKSSGFTKSGTAQTTGSMNIKQAAKKGGRGTDPAAFAKLIENVNNHA